MNIPCFVGNYLNVLNDSWNEIKIACKTSWKLGLQYNFNLITFLLPYCNHQVTYILLVSLDGCLNGCELKFKC